MEHVLWIGGPPGAGKSTAARRFAHRHGLRFYGVDLHAYDHGARLGFEPGSWDREPAALAESFLAHSRDRVRLVLEDLGALPVRPAVVVEGPQLFPDLVAPLLTDPGRAVFVVPPEAVQRDLLARRGPRRPQVVERDLLMARRVRARAEALRLAVVESADAVEPLLAPFAGPPGDRRALLREENEDIHRQVAAHLRATGVGDVPDVPFVCECGRPECDERVPLSLADRTGAVLAPGH